MNKTPETAQYPHARQLYFLKTAIFLIFTSISLHLFGFKKVYAFLYKFSKPKITKPKEHGNDLKEAIKIADVVIFINREWSFFMAYCLSESLVLWWFLRRKGIPADFKLGVRTITGPFESHAWVEYKCTVLNDLKSINQIYYAFDFHRLTIGYKKT